MREVEGPRTRARGCRGPQGLQGPHGAWWVTRTTECPASVLIVTQRDGSRLAGRLRLSRQSSGFPGPWVREGRARAPPRARAPAGAGEEAHGGPPV